MGKKSSKALVTGGAGFIGSHIVDRLLDQDFDVRVIDNLSTGNLQNLADHRTKRLHLIRADIRDFGKVKSAVKDVDVVFHEAALVSPVFSTKDPKLTEDINVKGTLNLLEASIHSGVKRFIFASSAAVYGNIPYIKMKENMTLNPTTPYGVSKLAAEFYTRVFHQLHGIETVCLRYFNVFGPRQACSNNSAYAAVIPIFINRLSQDLAPTVYGDGEQSRDFVYVEDIVEANMLALRCNEAVGEVFNIGSGTRVTINQLATLLKELAKKKDLANSHLPPRLADIRHGYADISRAKKVLGYEPRFSIREGLKKFLECITRKNIPPEKSPAHTPKLE